MSQPDKSAREKSVAKRPRDLPTPVIIIASRESGGSLLSALLGAHPEFYGAPQLNLLAFDEVWQLLEYAHVPRDANIHGFQRMLGEFLIGEQTIQSMQAANRWLSHRSSASAAEVHADIRSLVGSCRLVDYSPLVGQNRAAMERAIEAVPDAQFIHLTRNPWAHGRAMCRPVWQTVMTSLDYWGRQGHLRPCMDVYEIGEQWVDWSVQSPVFDTQFAWYRTQSAARDVLGELPTDRAIHLNLDELLKTPGSVLSDLLSWLGADAGDANVLAMLNAGVDTYDHAGPYTASFGVDFEMLDVPVSHALEQGKHHDLPPRGTALPWRGDGEPLLDEVMALANDLGYAVAE